MTQTLAGIGAIFSNGRIEIVGVPEHLGGLQALLTFGANAAWQARARIVERDQLRGLARDFGRVLAASYLAGKLDYLIAELEGQERKAE
jgi:hypothetical protein